MKKASLAISIVVLSVTVLLTVLALSLGGPSDIQSTLIGTYFSPISFGSSIVALVFAILDIRKTAPSFAKLPIILSILAVVITVVPVFLLVYSGI